MGILPSLEAIPQGLPVLPAVTGVRPPPLISLPANAASLQQQPVIPTARQEGSGAGPATVQVPVGLYLGDALLPLPQRLVDKISRLEFVEMSELLPEYWLVEDASEARCYHANTRRRRTPVTDILTWTQCFASLASMLSSNRPEQTSDLLAYLSTIVRCHKEFSGLGWVQYDAAFRRQAAITQPSREISTGEESTRPCIVSALQARPGTSRAEGYA